MMQVVDPWKKCGRGNSSSTEAAVFSAPVIQLVVMPLYTNGAVLKKYQLCAQAKIKFYSIGSGFCLGRQASHSHARREIICSSSYLERRIVRTQIQ